LVRGIRIVRETRRRRLVAEPPKGKEHPWAPGHAAGRSRAYISLSAMDAVVAHCKAQAQKGLEAMGFLSGGVFSWKGRSYGIARDALTAPLEATEVHVRFDRTGFPGLFAQLDRLDYEYIIVGWYHSHPGYGCFMSGTDQDTQVSGFSEPFHVALVVDTVGKEMKTFRLARRNKGATAKDIAVPFEEVPLMVYADGDWPWPGPKRSREGLHKKQ